MVLSVTTSHKNSQNYQSTGRLPQMLQKFNWLQSFRHFQYYSAIVRYENLQCKIQGSSFGVSFRRLQAMWRI